MLFPRKGEDATAVPGRTTVAKPPRRQFGSAAVRASCKAPRLYRVAGLRLPAVLDNVPVKSSLRVICRLDPSTFAIEFFVIRGPNRGDADAL